MVPRSLKSLLLAPTETRQAPEGFAHPCRTTSQTDRSYLDTGKDTSTVAPGEMLTLSKPRRMLGAELADGGGCR